MSAFEESEAIDGAYYFYMPIHSYMGILKAIFIPWSPARYESVVIGQGEYVWAVHKGTFVLRNINDTNIFSRPGVRKYIGRELETDELNRLNQLLGKRSIPGVRDCRKLKIV